VQKGNIQRSNQFSVEIRSNENNLNIMVKELINQSFYNIFLI